MRAVRIGEIAGRVDLVRLNLPQQLDDHRDVFLAERLLLHAARFVERHVQEVQPLVGDAAASAGRPGFAAADHAFDRLHFGAVDLARLLVAAGTLRRAPRALRPSLAAIRRKCVLNSRDEIGEADRVVVEHGDVAGRLVGHVHLVPMIDQPDERAAHRNHVVVRMRREHEHALRENVVVRLRTVARLLARGPACRRASR